MSGRPSRDVARRGYSARFSRVVRILLPLTICAVFGASGGCVVPVGPDFQDPQAIDEQPPYLVQFSVAAIPGTSVTLNATKFTFSVGFGDANLNDTLTGRWMANYPPNVSMSTAQIDGDMVGVHDPKNSGGVAIFSEQLDCDDFLKAADRSLTLIVSDRGFSPPADPSTNAALPYNFDKNGKLALVMVGWKINGCP
jgi:hypothetical protein